MLENPSAFLSYARFNDDYDEQAISRLCDRLAGEVHMQTGIPFVLFRDQKHIPWGGKWLKFVDSSISVATLMLIIVTPSYFRSKACEMEFESFSKREEKLGRADLILPLYYIEVDDFQDESVLASNLWMAEIKARQFADWRSLRSQSSDSTEWRLAIAGLGSKLKSVLRAIEQSQATDPVNAKADRQQNRILEEPAQKWQPTVNAYQASTRTQREIIRFLYMKIKKADVELDDLYAKFSQEVPSRIASVAELHYRVKDLAHAGLLQMRNNGRKSTLVLKVPSVHQDLIDGDIIES